MKRQRINGLRLLCELLIQVGQLGEALAKPQGRKEQRKTRFEKRSAGQTRKKNAIELSPLAIFAARVSAPNEREKRIVSRKGAKTQGTAEDRKNDGERARKNCR